MPEILIIVLLISCLLLYKRLNPKTVYITLEGNIGAGKSTLLQDLVNSSKFTKWNITLVDEPLDWWQSIKDEWGNSILELFYQDKTKWSFVFQNMANLTRRQKLEEAKEKALANYQWWNPFVYSQITIISERSPESDYQVFFTMLKNDGYISKIEEQIYQAWNTFQPSMKPQAIFYLDQSLETIQERIIKRSRQGENLISPEYLKRLDFYYQKWLNECQQPVFELNDLTDLENSLSSL